MEVEDAGIELMADLLDEALFYLLSRVGLTPWWTTEQQRHLTIGDSLLGEIVVDDDGVFFIITEPLTYHQRRVSKCLRQ